MPVLNYKTTQSVQIAKGVNRKIAYLNNMLTAIIDFTNGPMTKPDVPHKHDHEQITYVAKGEIFVFIGDEKHHLNEGDLFLIPSNTLHTIQTLSNEVRLVDTFTPIREDFL